LIWGVAAVVLGWGASWQLISVLVAVAVLMLGWVLLRPLRRLDIAAEKIQFNRPGWFR
jgi:low affinity Fe/Cu permease